MSQHAANAEKVEPELAGFTFPGGRLALETVSACAIYSVAFLLKCAQ
jgi:hypothetical protein